MAEPVAGAAGGSRTTVGRTGGFTTAGLGGDGLDAVEAAGFGADAGRAMADATGAAEAEGISAGVAATIAAAVAAAAADAGLPAGGQATSAALRGLPIGVVALPWRTAAMSSSLG